MTAQTLPNNRIPNKQEPLYSISEAAKLLGISPSTLRRWEDEGRLVPVRTSGGNHRRYSQDNVKRLLKSFRQDTDSRRTNDVKPQIEIPEYPLGTGGRLPPKIPVRTLEQIRQPLRRRKRVPHRLVDVTLLLISLALLYSVFTPLAQERLYRVFASPLQNLIYSTVKIVSPQQAELIKPGIMNPIVDVNDVLEYVEMTDQEGEIETGLRAKLTLIGSEMITQTLRVVKEGTFNTARFLGSIFLGPGKRYLINPLGDAFLRKLNVSGRSDLDGGIAVDTDNFTVSGKTGATEIKGEVTAGEAFKVSFDPGVQSGDLTGIEVDFSKIVDPATWTLYGVHIDDAIGDASTAYGVYVEGENWDYGIYSEDDIATAESLKVGRNMEIEGKTEIGGTLTIGDETTISGNLLPGIDSTFDIGAVDQEWANLYVDDITAGTVASGDTTLSSLTVTNQTDLQGDVLDTTGNLTLNDTVDISGALNVTNSTTLSDTLTVAGATTLSSTLDVVGDTSIGGDLSVTGSVSGGAADFSSLIVTGTSDLRGDVLDTTGNLTLNDTVDISGALNVTGAGTFSSTLYADGGISTTAGDLSLTSATGTTSITDQLALPTQGSTGGLVIGGDADLYRGGSSRLETTSYLRFLRGAAGNLAVSTAVSGDTNDRFSIYTDGDLKWGDGTVGQDTNFYRSAADTLKTDDTLVVGTQLELPTDKKVQFRDPQIYMHSGEDGYLNLIADSAVRLSRGGAESGKLEFWDGSAFSINLYAGTTNVLETDDSLWVGTEIRAGYWQALGSVAFKTLPSGDTSWARFFILNSGELQWGPGNAPGDTNLYRSAADTLKTDDSFAVAGDLTASGQGFFNHLPTQAHTGTWAIGSGTWNQDDASIYINPSTSVGDGNLIAGAVGGLVKFAVDTEGDIHGNNLILAGSISQATTTIAGNLTVQGDTTLGDASGDTLTIYPDTTQFISGSSTLDIYTASGDTTLTIDNTGTGVAHLTITGDLTVGGDDIRDSGSNIVLSFDGSGKIDSVATLLTGTALTFRDAQLTIYSSTDGQLDIDADTEVEITAPTTQIVSSTTFDVDGGAITIDGSTLSLDSTDTTNLTMTANAAGDKTMTIAASNSGAGAGLISISSDGDLSLDTSGGTLYLNNTNNQAINTGTGNFTFDTTGSVLADSATTVSFDAVTDLDLGTSNDARNIAIGTGNAIDTINIGTGGTATDIIAIGDSSASLALTDADWSVTSAGIITTTGLANLNGGIAVDTDNFTVSGTSGATSITTSATTGDVFNLSFDAATTQGAGLLQGLDIDLSNLTAVTGQNLYGLSIQDTSNSTAALAGDYYALYQQGTNWDYGGYFEDDVYIGGTLTGSGSGTFGYWSRTGTILSPATSGDDIALTDDDWIGISASDERIIFDTAGDIEIMGANVGIGTTSPTSPESIDTFLHIYSATHAGLVLSDGTDDWDMFVDGNRMQWSYEGTNLAALHESGGFAFGNGYQATDPGAGNVIIEGNVGIGTDSPSGSLKLDVEGQVGATEYCDENGANCSDPYYSWKRYTIGLSGYSNTLWYPVSFVASPASTSKVHFFTISGHSTSGGDPYNNNTLTGLARGGGWNDLPPMADVTFQQYQNEDTIYGIYKGTQSYTNVVVYLRGGQNYNVYSPSQVTLHTTDYTSGGSTFQAGVGTPAGTNIALIMSLHDKGAGWHTNRGATIAESLTVSGNLTVDTNTLYVDSTNNGVGIGTTGPFYGFELTVAGDSYYSGVLKAPNLGSSSTAVYDLYVDGAGTFYKYTSSLRYKSNITDIELDTSKIYDLRPVSYTNDSGNRDFGLIAEEVAEVIPELVIFDQEGRPDAVRYESLSVLLLNELKKQKDGLKVDTEGDLATEELTPVPEQSSVQDTAADGEQQTVKILAGEIEAETGVFQRLTVMIEAIFEKITAKTAEIAEAVIQTLRVEKAEIKTLEVEAIATGENTDSAGSEVVKEGEGSVTIDSLAVTERSKIYVTFTTDYAPATRFWIANKRVGESFTVELDAPVAKEAKFDWWIVN